MNQKKSEILGTGEKVSDVMGVKVFDRVSYLGLSIACDDRTTVRLAKASMAKYLGFIKGSLRSSSL